MNNWLLLLPLISAIIGWFITWLGIEIFFTRVLPKKLPALGQKIGEIASGIFSITDLEGKLTGVENMKKIMPVIETHIDVFLRHKLSTAMPVISMFIGEKTINQLKEVFMKELEVIFPETMKTYLTNLEKEISIEKLITEKMSTIDPGEASTNLRKTVGPELTQIQIFGAISGLIIGIIQLTLTQMIGN